MAIIQSDETKNEAKCILANLCTIVKYYGNTTTAQYIKYSCDDCILGYNNKLNTFFDVIGFGIKLTFEYAMFHLFTFRLICF